MMAKGIRPSENRVAGFQTAFERYGTRASFWGGTPYVSGINLVHGCVTHPTYDPLCRYFRAGRKIRRSGIYARLTNVGKFRNVGHECPTYGLCVLSDGLCRLVGVWRKPRTRFCFFGETHGFVGQQGTRASPWGDTLYEASLLPSFPRRRESWLSFATVCFFKNC